MAVKPCSKCLQARRAAKNTLVRVAGRMTNFSLYSTNRGELVISRSTGSVVKDNDIPGVSRDDKVYAAGKKLYKLTDSAPVLIAGVTVLSVQHF